MYQKKKVFITGGFGFIGSALVKRLKSEKAEIFLLKRVESGIERLKGDLTRLNFIQGSLLDYINLKNQLKKIQPDYIFHLSSFGGHYSQQKAEEILHINIWGTFNLLEAVKEFPFEAFINIGSSSEYGFKKKPMKEKDLLEPESFYAISKASATLLCRFYSRTYKKNIVTIRPFTVYGPEDNSDKFIPTVIRCCLLGQPLKLTANLSCHDFIYIDDLIEGILKAGQKKNTSGEIFNLGGGRQYSNEQIISFIERAIGKKIKVEKGAYQNHKWDTPFWQADISKSKKILGWKPKIGIEEGIKKTTDFYQNQIRVTR